MRIFDKNDQQITQPDLTLGRLAEDRLFIQHHEATFEVAEVGHYQVVAQYPETGGQDVQWVVDVPGVPARDAWDEYEEILRYIPYTPEELEEMQMPTLESRVDTLENSTADLAEALELLLSGVTQ